MDGAPFIFHDSLPRRLRVFDGDRDLDSMQRSTHTCTSSQDSLTPKSTLLPGDVILRKRSLTLSIDTTSATGNIRKGSPGGHVLWTAARPARPQRQILQKRKRLVIMQRMLLIAAYLLSTAALCARAQLHRPRRAGARHAGRLRAARRRSRARRGGRPRHHHCMCGSWLARRTGQAGRLPRGRRCSS